MSESVELDFSLLPGFFAHPGQGFDVVAEGLFKRRDQLLHIVLGGGREILLYPVLAYGFTQCAVGESCAALPAGGLLGLALQRLLEEVEVGVVEGAREPRSEGVYCVEAQVALQAVEAFAGKDLVQRLEESGVATLASRSWERAESRCNRSSRSPASAC